MGEGSKLLEEADLIQSMIMKATTMANMATTMAATATMVDTVTMGDTVTTTVVMEATTARCVKGVYRFLADRSTRFQN